MSAETRGDETISRNLMLAIGLTLITLVAEVAGGVWTNSLALLSDAAHVFMDVFALGLSLLAIRFSARPVTERRTFGLHRLEILASLINGATLLAIAGGILYEAWGRFAHPEAVKSQEMFLIASIGLVMNLIAALTLHGHDRNDLNVRSAYLHVIGDAAASVGVIAGGVIMLLTGWYVIDALVSVAIAILIAFGSVRLLREAGHILLEGVPTHIELTELVGRMQAVEGVAGIHHLHLWSVCSHITVLAAHVDLLPEHRDRANEILRVIETMLETEFQISYTTLQHECTQCVTGPVLQSVQHRHRHSSLCSHGHSGHHH